MHQFPFCCTFIKCFGLHVLFCSEIPQPLSASTANFLLSHTSHLTFSSAFSLVTIGHASWSGQSFISSLPLPTHAPPPCFSTTLRVEHVISEQSTKGAFSGPLRGPLCSLCDLSPRVEHIQYSYMDTHAQSAGCNSDIVLPEMSLWSNWCHTKISWV